MLKVVKIEQAGENQIVSRFNEFLYNLVLLARQNKVKIGKD